MATPTMTEAFPPFPLEELVNGIEKFDALNLNEQKSFLQELVAKHPVASMDWSGSWRYRRSRILEPGNSAIHVHDAIWNIHSSPKIGRANPAGFEVLYVADRLETALAETHVQTGTVLLSEFSILPGQLTRFAPLGEFARIARSGRGYLSGTASKKISELLNACDPQQAKALLITDTFLESVLRNGDDNYELSSTVAKAIFEKLPQVNAVAYQSVRRPDSLCFAIKTTDFWSTWGIVSIKRFQASHLAMQFYSLQQATHVKGITNGGDLVWDDMPDVAEATLMLDPPWTPIDGKTGPV